MKQYLFKINKAKNIISLMFFALVFNIANAQDLGEASNLEYEEQKSYEIEGVTISGVIHENPENLIFISGLNKGDIVKVPGDEKFRTAAKKLWARGRQSNASGSFGDIDIQTVKIEGNKIWINIALTERPRIMKYEFENVKKGNEKDLKERVTIRPGAPFSDYVVQSSVAKIRKYFAEKGYLHAKVAVEINNDPNLENGVNLVFAVDRGDKVKIKEIAFEGNEQFSDSKLKKSLKSTKQRGFALHSFFKSKKYIEAKYEDDKDNLMTFYNRKGYRDAELLIDSVYKISEKRVGIKFKVYEGTQYFFRNISWIGNTKYPSQMLSNQLKIEMGDVYDPILLQENLLDDERAVLNYFYQDNGYIFSRMIPVETNIVGDSIDVEIQVYEGDQATLNRITIAGNDKTNEHVIRRELRTVPGDLFSITKYKESIRMLSSIGHFDPEDLMKNAQYFLDPNPAESTVDINYRLSEVGNDKFEMSGGWGANMLIGSVGVMFTNFSARNFFDFKTWKPVPSGDGQTLSLNFRTTGKRYQQFSISFMEPWLGGHKPIALSASAYFSNQTSAYNPYFDNGYYGGGGMGGYYPGYNYNYDSNESMKVWGFSLGLEHRLKWPDYLFTLYYDVSLQRYQLRNWKGGFLFSNGDANDFSFNLVFGRNSTDQNIFPRRGSKFSVGVKFTPPYSLFSLDKNYAEMKQTEKYKWIEYHKWSVDGSFFNPIVGDLTLMAKAQFGYLGYYNKKWGYSPFGGFIVGGGGMSGYVMYGQDIIALRGYEDNSLTPYANNAYHGNVYNKFTMELRFPIIMEPASQIYALAFLEGGNCWNSIDKFNPFDIKRSAGLGLRVNLQMLGTLGLDWGYGFDKISGRDMKRHHLHFVMGHTF